MSRAKNNQYLNNNENLPIKVEFDYTPDQIEEMRKCKEDIVYFAENYFFIRVLGKGRVKIQLHDVQKRIIRRIVDNNNTIVCASRQTGKALDINTPIPTPNGWTTMGELKDGDIVFGADGLPTTVVKAWDVMYDRPCYEVSFSNGEKIIADEGHLWMTQTLNERRRNKGFSKKTTKQIAESVRYNNASNHRIQLSEQGIQCETANHPIHPYLFGLWLGNGCTHNFKIIGTPSDIVEYKEFFLNNNILTEDNISLHTITKNDDDPYFELSVKGDMSSGNTFRSYFHQNMIRNKRIPPELLRGSHSERLWLLRGLMDSYGSTSGRKCHFYNTDLNIVAGVKELLSSLSINYSVSIKPNFHKGKRGKDVSVVTFSTKQQVFNLKRKRDKLIISDAHRTNSVYITSVEPVASVPVRCITAGNDEGMFLCGKKMVPTSNTTIMTVVCLWYALFRKDVEVAILANKEVQAKEILDRIKLAYEEIPNYIKAGVWTFSQEIIRLTNGSKIYVSTTSATSLRGKSVDILFIDEFAFVPPEIASAFFKSVVPVLCSGEDTKMIITSTPNGLNNKFYEIFTNAESGRTTEWTYDRMYWYEIPGRDEKWKKKQLDLIGYDMDMWNQEFEIQFLEDGSSAINLEVIERLKKLCRAPEHTMDNGAYKIWRSPAPDRIYSIGVDVSEGVGQDWSVAQVMDITDPTDIIHCAQYATNSVQPYVYAEKLNQIARSWGRPFLCIERNKEGGQVVDALYNVHKYDNIIHYTMKNDKRGVYQNMGIFCHQNSKYTGIMNMKYFIEHMEAVEIYDIQTLTECESFVRKENKTWSARKGHHDDRVMSMVWALVILEKDIAETYFDVHEYDDTGKPIRITDPNQDLANRAFYDPDTYSSYAKTGGGPMPAFFNIGGNAITQQSFEMEKHMVNGWSIS